MSLTEKEQKILEILENTEEKLILSDLSVKIKSNLPYTSHLVSKLQAKSLIKTEQKDGRTKYVYLQEGVAIRTADTMKPQIAIDTIELALKLISFFTTHANEISYELTRKLLESLSPEEQAFINSKKDRIEILEDSWRSK